MINLKKELPELRSIGSLAQLVAADPFATTSSRWSERRWVLDGRSPGRKPFAITWYPEETGATLLNELKYLAACLLIYPIEGRTRLKYSNAGTFTIALRYFARFMSEKSYASLAELDENAFAAFQAYVVRSASEVTTTLDGLDLGEAECEETPLLARSRSLATPEMSGELDDADPDRPTHNFVQLRLRIWSWIHWVKAELQAAGIPIHFGDLFRQVTLPELARRLSAQSLSDMEDLPDEVLLPVLTEAYRLIGEPAEQVIDLQERYLAIGPKSGPGDVAVSSARQALVTNHVFMIDGEASPWYEIGQGGAANPSLVLHELVRLIRDACMVVLAAGIGWRISEAASIEIEDRDEEAGLPSCIFVTPSYTGTSEHFWIRGLLSKHRPEPTPEDWLIGARLTGTDTEPMTVRAVRVLERLYKPWRRLASSPTLRRHLVVDWVGAGVTFDPKNVRYMQIEQLRNGSQEFIKKRVGLKQRLEALVVNNPRLEPYYASEGECIRPHQWRRTFFRLMYRIDSNLLPAISRHFKHISLAVTENGYAPKSPAALEDREAVATSELVAALFKRGENTEVPVAGGNKILERHRALLASIIDGDTLEDAAPRLADFAAEHDLRIWPAEHGSCLIGLNPDKAACHLKGGKTDWRVSQPNLSARNPGLCCSCPNLIISRGDAPFWERRYRANRQSWLESGRAPSFRFAKDRARQARTILEHLNSVPSDLMNEED